MGPRVPLYAIWPAFTSRLLYSPYSHRIFSACDRCRTAVDMDAAVLLFLVRCACCIWSGATVVSGLVYLLRLFTRRFFCVAHSRVDAHRSCLSRAGLVALLLQSCADRRNAAGLHRCELRFFGLWRIYERADLYDAALSVRGIVVSMLARA